MGVPLFRMAAEMAGGELDPSVGAGKRNGGNGACPGVSHIDRMPWAIWWGDDDGADPCEPAGGFLFTAAASTAGRP